MDDLEFNALVQVFTITDDRNAALEEACEAIGDLSMVDAGVIPYLMIGSVDEIVEHIQAVAIGGGSRTSWSAPSTTSPRCSTPSAERTTIGERPVQDPP